MKTTKITGLECPDCGEFVEVDVKKLNTLYKCSECNTIYETETDAEECCEV